MQTPSPNPSPRPMPGYQPKPVKPRKVRGGVKLAGAWGVGADPESWAAQRWLRLVEQVIPGAAMAAGLEYAKIGQTRSISMEPGWVRGVVQGTVITAYKTSISLPALTHEQGEQVINAMVDQAVYAAKLLAGELPANIEDVFVPMGLRLFPEVGELGSKCSCREPQPWCKHACCLAYLVAERFTTDPFLIFTLRGLPREELLERLRQRRAVAAAAGGGSVLVYSPLVPGASDVQAPPLEECVEGFWDAGPELDRLDTPVEPPEVSHPLLRRLGPSPFGAGGGKFPLVGLLATCYEVISEAVVKGQDVEVEAEARVEGEDEEGGGEVTESESGGL